MIDYNKYSTLNRFIHLVAAGEIEGIMPRSNNTFLTEQLITHIIKREELALTFRDGILRQPEDLEAPKTVEAQPVLTYEIYLTLEDIRGIFKEMLREGPRRERISLTKIIIPNIRYVRDITRKEYDALKAITNIMIEDNTKSFIKGIPAGEQEVFKIIESYNLSSIECERLFLLITGKSRASYYRLKKLNS